MEQSGLETTPQFATLVELLQVRARRQATQMAYTFLDSKLQETPITYRDLENRARAIAACLQSRITKGERVLLLYPPCLEYIAAFLGCLYAGVIAVPAYPPDPLRLHKTLPRLQTIIADSQASLVLTTKQIDRLFRQLQLLQRLSQIPWMGKIPQKLLHRYNVPVLDGIFHQRWIATDRIANTLAQKWYEPDIDAETVAFLQYTSGSTAAPKGVMLTHGNLLYNEEMVRHAMGHDETTIFAGWLPLYHDMGLIGNVLQPLYLGIPCYLMSPLHFLQRPLRWLQAISRYRATTSGAPNFAYDLCVRKVTEQQKQQLDLSCLKVLYNGAEPIRESTLHKFSEHFASCGFRRQSFYPCYGLAEASLLVTGGEHQADPVFARFDQAKLQENTVVVCETGQPLVGCGKSWLAQQVLLVDPQKKTPCHEGQVGEIWIAGANVAKGYWNRKDETKRTFKAYLTDGRGPYLRSGDLGFFHGGELFITGRIKDMIILHGNNYYPQDIELAAEQSHPAVRPGCCAAFSVEIDEQERLVIAAEVRCGDEPLDTAQLMAIREAICVAVREQYEIRVHAVALLKAKSIHKTSSGKIQRHACHQAFLAGTLETVG